ncbi:SulP family inorganic anion transporter [Tellurirhabdus rosea]|uniref:SulP family inorganic anion transporter n=1 Tax=Tellurirhabdus rosea TaxID=2674997 RepID=UPI00224D47D5|nr:SulP family inorganic anion transporter [Tellurirhabdus rosea]
MTFLKPLKSLSDYQAGFLRADFPAGLSVFLVALPLCLGIALASGAPLFSGLVAGIIGGIIVGFLSGSEVSVSGPAAGLAVIVADNIRQLGSFEAFLLAVALAGVIQLVLGVLRAGRFSGYFPDSVIKGMLVAIGVVIVLKQIPHALGRDNDYEGEFAFQQLADGENTISEIYRAIETASIGAVMISLVSFIILIGWEKIGGRGFNFVRLLPGALLAVVAGVLLNEAFRVYAPAWYLGDSAHQHMVQIPQIKAGASVFSIFDFPDLSQFSNPRIYLTALTIAIVASLETLLNLEAADRLDPLRRVSSPDQELVAQGLGNLVSGLVGGLPVTSVVVRTSANIYGGTRTRVSAIIHGVLLALAVFLTAPLLNRIPLACLAAVLIMVGYKLAKPAVFRAIYRQGFNQFVPFMVTVLGIVFTDLLTGIGIGLVVGIFFVLYTNNQKAFIVVRDGQHVLIKFIKDIYFIHKPQIKEALRSLQPGDSVIVDGHRATFIDTDVQTMLKEFRETARSQKISYEISSVTPNKSTNQKYARSRKTALGQQSLGTGTAGA